MANIAERTTTGMRTRLRPGVVTGADYLALLDACREGGYALPAVNVVGTSSANAVLEAAASNRSDVVIQLSNGGARFFAGEGIADGMEAQVLGAVSAALHVHTVAAAYGVCVVLHTDHADRKLLPWVEGLLDQGEEHARLTGRPLFSSHMLDLSERAARGEHRRVRAGCCARMAPLGMSLEIELGVTGGEEDGVGTRSRTRRTTPSSTPSRRTCCAPRTRCRRSATFTVAASFGNVHGVYKPGNVKLRPEILRASQAGWSPARASGGPKPLDLVFHGGSGSEKEQDPRRRCPTAS